MERENLHPEQNQTNHASSYLHPKENKIATSMFDSQRKHQHFPRSSRNVSPANAMQVYIFNEVN